VLKKYKNIVTILLPVVFLAILVWYVSTNWSKFESLSIKEPLFLLLSATLVTINVFCFGKIFELAIKPHGVNLSNHEVFGLAGLTRFSKQISPAYIGAAVRAVYLKKNYGVSYAKFSSSFLLSNVLQLAISGIVAILIFILHEQGLTNSQPLFLIFVLATLFILLIYGPITFFVSLFKKRTNKFIKNKIIERLTEALEQYDKIRKNPDVIIPTFFWMILALLISSVTLYALYSSLGVDISIVSTIFISAFLSWTMVFSITPGSIGIREGLMVLGASLMSVSVPETLAVALILRLVTFLVVTLISSYYAPKLLNTTLLNIKRVKG
jgi:uncharacterized protein (TIRG00374 family)